MGELMVFESQYEAENTHVDHIRKNFRVSHIFQTAYRTWGFWVYA